MHWSSSSSPAYGSPTGQVPGDLAKRQEQHVAGGGFNARWQSLGAVLQLGALSPAISGLEAFVLRGAQPDILR